MKVTKEGIEFASGLGVMRGAQLPHAAYPANLGIDRFSSGSATIGTYDQGPIALPMTGGFITTVGMSTTNAYFTPFYVETGSSSSIDVNGIRYYYSLSTGLPSVLFAVYTSQVRTNISESHGIPDKRLWYEDLGRPSSNGVKEATFSSTMTLYRGWYWLMIHNSASGTFNSMFNEYRSGENDSYGFGAGQLGIRSRNNYDPFNTASSIALSSSSGASFDATPYNDFQTYLDSSALNASLSSRSVIVDLLW